MFMNTAKHFVLFDIKESLQLFYKQVLITF
jgi:hypothetical protein